VLGSWRVTDRPVLSFRSADTAPDRLRARQCVELPFGEGIALWWIDAAGSIHDRPVAGADLLPGGFILPGLVDAHADPAAGSGPAGLAALDEGAARAA